MKHAKEDFPTFQYILVTLSNSTGSKQDQNFVADIMYHDLVKTMAYQVEH